MMIVPVRVRMTQPTFSKKSSNLSMCMLKRVGDKGQPYLNPIYKPPVFLKLVITFSYNLISISLNSKGTFIYSILFQRLDLCIVLKYFLMSMKKHRRLVLLLQHSSVMILSVIRWSIFE
jgi:hypothetical protein